MRRDIKDDHLPETSKFIFQDSWEGELSLKKFQLKIGPGRRQRVPLCHKLMIGFNLAGDFWMNFEGLSAIVIKYLLVKGNFLVFLAFLEHSAKTQAFVTLGHSIVAYFIGRLRDCSLESGERTPIIQTCAERGRLGYIS